MLFVKKHEKYENAQGDLAKELFVMYNTFILYSGRYIFAWNGEVRCFLKKQYSAFRLISMLLAALFIIFPVSAGAQETVVPETTAAVAVSEPVTVPAETVPETVPATEPAAAVEETVPATEPAVLEETVPPTEPAAEPAVTAEETVPAEVQDPYAQYAEVEIVPGLDTLPVPVVPDRYDEVPLYFQTDYPHHMYGSGTIASSGCSITCLAMVATYMTDHEYLPDELARYFGGRAENNVDRLEKGAEAMQLAWEELENFHRAMDALRAGKVVIVLMESSSLFTASQHFIVLTGINEDGLIMVNDPFEPNYEKWDLKRALQEGFTEGDICRGFSGAWAFDKSAMPEEPFLYYEEYEGGDPRYPDIQLTEEDRELLARVIWVEAQGECEEGQQAVAEVVLNRMASPDFGNTLKGVIYGEGQFRSVPFLDDAEPYQAQYEAIERAIYGPYVLPEGVVHFATFRTNNNVWGQIGGHIFCYQS